MNREIKFRAWDKDKKEMVGGFGVHSDFGHAFDMDFDNGEEYIFENYILMQFTGLKDKNGKEIYEGDIVMIYRFKRDNDIGEVKYHFNRFVIGFSDNFGDLGKVEFYASKMNDYDVIGNIHENKELLTN